MTTEEKVFTLKGDPLPPEDLIRRIEGEDFLAYLRSLAAEADWETLPEHLQDAIDRILIDEVRSERAEALDLDTILKDNKNGE